MIGRDYTAKKKAKQHKALMVKYIHVLLLHYLDYYTAKNSKFPVYKYMEAYWKQDVKTQGNMRARHISRHFLTFSSETVRKYTVPSCSLVFFTSYFQYVSMYLHTGNLLFFAVLVIMQRLKSIRIQLTTASCTACT